MPMFKKTMSVLLIVAVALLLISLYGHSTADETTTLDSEEQLTRYSAQSEELPGEIKMIYVYVTGAVNKPGMVEIEGVEGTIRVADAVNACDGLLPTADIENFNMAEIISDGQHIRIPEKVIEQAAALPEDNRVTTSKSLGSKKNPSANGDAVNINTANADELDALPGIGPAMAERIIDYRQTHGPFKSIEEIQNVRGIGQKKFDNIKDRICT